MNDSVDHFSLLAKFLHAQTGFPVYVDLPTGFELKSLPSIGLSFVGTAERRPGLNVLGIDVEDVDVDLFVSPAMWESGEAVKLAHRIRIMLEHDFSPQSGVRVLGCSRPSRRPDRNPKIRRIGLTVSVASPVTEVF